MAVSTAYCDRRDSIGQAARLLAGLFRDCFDGLLNGLLGDFLDGLFDDLDVARRGVDIDLEHVIKRE